MAKFSEDSARRNSMLRLIVLAMMSWKTIVVVIMFVSVTKPEAKQNYTLGFLLANKTRDQPAFSYFPAIQVALNDIKNDESLLPNINLNWVYNDTECDKHVAIRKHLWQLNNKVDAFFGPSCHCVTPANVATAFDKPLMSYLQINRTLLVDEACNVFVLEIEYKKWIGRLESCFLWTTTEISFHSVQ